MAEKREHRRLQEIERRGIGHRSAKASQYLLEMASADVGSATTVEDRIGDAMSKRGVEVDQVMELPPSRSGP
jgi:hypothetical protein